MVFNRRKAKTTSTTPRRLTQYKHDDPRLTSQPTKNQTTMTLFAPFFDEWWGGGTPREPVPRHAQRMSLQKTDSSSSMEQTMDIQPLSA
jgi:hypothetical protein